MSTLTGSQPTKNLPEGSELRFDSEMRGVGGSALALAAAGLRNFILT
jgi:hypothetical protein